MTDAVKDVEDRGWRVEDGVARGRLSALAPPELASPSPQSPVSSPFVVHVNPAGELVFIYDDQLSSLLDLGKCCVARASHVELSPIGGRGIGWQADLSPVGGPTLGPFALRDDALKAEREWLNEHL